MLTVDIIAKLGPVLLMALADIVMKWQAQQQNRMNDQQLGAQTTASSVNQGTINAQQRGAEAQVNAPDLGGITDKLGDGTF